MQNPASWFNGHLISKCLSDPQSRYVSPILESDGRAEMSTLIFRTLMGETTVVEKNPIKYPELAELFALVKAAANDDDSPEVKACVSKKIPILMDEGYEQAQAVAIAFSMCRKDPEAHLKKTGTSEGAKAGWEARRGGGKGEAPKSEKPSSKEPAEMSAIAVQMSKKARENPTRENHEAAKDAHAKAMQAHDQAAEAGEKSLGKLAGKKDIKAMKAVVEHHRAMSSNHFKLLEVHNSAHNFAPAEPKTEVDPDFGKPKGGKPSSKEPDDPESVKLPMRAAAALSNVRIARRTAQDQLAGAKKANNPKSKSALASNAAANALDHLDEARKFAGHAHEHVKGSGGMIHAAAKAHAENEKKLRAFVDQHPDKREASSDIMDAIGNMVEGVSEGVGEAVRRIRESQGPEKALVDSFFPGWAKPNSGLAAPNPLPKH